MAVLGILTCEILELEFAHLLAHDRAVSRVTVLDDQYSSRFTVALEAEGHGGAKRIPRLEGFQRAEEGGLEVLVRVLEIALHNRKRLLQEGLVKAAQEMSRHVDGIVLGYGLCGNALEKYAELFSDVGVPVILPMDEDHPVDDCVGLVIGGRECYYSEQCKVAGTFFMIPGWTHHWKAIFSSEYGALSYDLAKAVFEHYERSLLIPTPVLAEGAMRENIEEFTRLFGFRTEVREGTLDILKETWNRAKAAVAGAEGAPKRNA